MAVVVEMAVETAVEVVVAVAVVVTESCTVIVASMTTTSMVRAESAPGVWMRELALAMCVAEAARAARVEMVLRNILMPV